MREALYAAFLYALLWAILPIGILLAWWFPRHAHDQPRFHKQ